MTTYACKICWEDFSDRNDVITPCKCTGSVKYICKGCLNKFLEVNKDTDNYLKCTDCKESYRRESPNINLELNAEVFDEVLFGTGILIILTILILKMGEFKSIYVFSLLFLYFISLTLLSRMTILGYNVESLISFVVLLYFIALFTPYPYSYPMYVLWTIGLFATASYKLLHNSWDNILRMKYKKVVQELKCMMFDFDLSRYVGGVI